MTVDLPAHDGTTVTIGRAAPGRRQVAWFFPRAATPNCTVQARALIAEWSSLAARAVDVVGVSYDTLDVLQAWGAELQTPFPLCSATVAQAEALGAARPATDPWRQAIPARVALIADEDAKVLARWRVDDPHQFAAQVAAALGIQQ